MAQSTRIPMHLNSMTRALRTMLERFPAQRRLREGDVYATNDPYSGGLHLPDIQTFRRGFSSTASRSPSPARSVTISMSAAVRRRATRGATRNLSGGLSHPTRAPSSRKAFRTSFSSRCSRRHSSCAQDDPATSARRSLRSRSAHEKSYGSRSSGAETTVNHPRADRELREANAGRDRPPCLPVSTRPRTSEE